MSGTGRVADLVRRLDILGTPDWRAGLARDLAQRAVALAQASSDVRSAPGGSPWADLKRPPSKATGAMRNGWGIRRADAAGFSIANSRFYAVYQNYGTQNMPGRPMVPVSGALPSTWRAAFDEAAKNHILEALK